MDKIIEGKTLDGEKRNYTFQLMDAATGLRLEYEKFSYLLHNDSVFELIKSDDFKCDLSSIRDVVLGLYTFDELEEFAAKMLKGATIQLEKGAPYQCDDNGMCDLFQGESEEFVTALFYAMCANYPKAVIPLIEAGKSTENDSTPQTTGPKKTTSESPK